MKRRALALTAALALVLTACSGPAGESAPTGGTQSPEPASSAPPSVSPSQEPGNRVSSVYTDWSKLEPYEADLGHYTRYYEDFTDRLIPVEGGYGGPLIPFAGEIIELSFGDWDEYYYGLALADGTVVCDPVYDSVYYAGTYDPDLNRYIDGESFLILWKTVVEENHDPERHSNPKQVCTVAAGDGSWVLEEEYIEYFTLSDGQLLLIDTDEAFWICGTDGTLERSPLKEKPSELWGDWWRLMGGFVNGVACMMTNADGQSVENRWFMANALTGEVTMFDGFSDISIIWGREGGPYYAADGETELYGYVDPNGSWVIEPQFRYARDFEGDYARVCLTTGEDVVIDLDGNIVLTLSGKSLRDCGGYYLDCTWSQEEQADTVYGVYDEQFRPIPDHPLNGKKLTNAYGIPATREGDLCTIWVGDATYTVETDADFVSFKDGQAVFSAEVMTDRQLLSGDVIQETAYTHGLYDFAAQRWIISLGAYSYIYDYGAGEELFYLATPIGEWGLKGDLFDREGRFVTSCDGLSRVSNGVIQMRNDGNFVFLDLNGEELFRWRIRDNGD